MKILLIKLRPGCKEKSSGVYPYVVNYYPPLNLQILASLTPNEEVEIVDENFDKINFDGDYDLIGLTAYGASELLRAKEVYKEFKKRNVPVVIGGPSIFCMPVKDALEYANSIVVGEAEGIWEKVIKDAQSNRLKRVYKKKELVGLSKLYALPRRDLTNNKNYMCHTVEISRGCPYTCDFCILHKFNKGGYRLYSIKRVIRDVELCLEHPTKTKRQVYFVDDNMSINQNYKIKLFKKLIPHNIAWSAQCDLSIVKNKKLLNVFSKSGCMFLAIGFESVNQESLRSVNKPAFNKVLEYKKAIKTLHDYGIRVLGDFMIGLDNDKPGVAQKTLDFISDSRLDFFIPNILTPEYGTQLFEKIEKEGRILTKEWSNYNRRQRAVFQPKNMTPQQLEEEYGWFVKHLPSNRMHNLYTLVKRVLTKKNVSNRNIKFATRLSLLLYSIRYAPELI